MLHTDTQTTQILEPRRNAKIRLSVVVPCFNEEAVINISHARLSQVLKGMAQHDLAAYEIIYVDDGSKDSTASKLIDLSQADPAVKVVMLSRNFGHQPAVSAGIDLANGDCVVLIDADLQDPPELIADMVTLWRSGYDVVYGQRTDRDGESAFKLATAQAFYRGLNRLSDVDIPLDVGDFRLMDRQVVDAIKSMPERDRFLRGMVSWVGFRQIGLPYRREARAAGESKYPLRKMILFALDGMLSFSLVPLRVVILLGLLILVLANFGIFYALINRLFTDRWVSGWTMLFIAVMFMGGVQLMVLGMIGEYVGRIYMASKERPLYLIKRHFGFHDRG
ncbi:glycosyltransferase family 2 protein [Candidatus Phycosocius spiralis]|uniref:Glycosyl transferase n=1 Tax=Candidatus Phycosocius spiralis TaxID=2815099 RepID=A0ABQ4PWI3_9PROT|nr:glycosyltransferase family 2 protein [Candidatus Phycosocius spiralis]GIU67362.1 glycosyl transferase [Candidatus Phycosocius spiralis]